MSKSIPQSQSAFSFLDEVEKAAPAPKPKRQPLRPPTQIEITEEPAVEKSKESVAATEPVDTVAATANTVPPAPKSVTEDPIIEEAEKKSAQTVIEKAAIAQIEKKVISTRGRRSVKENSMAADSVEMPDEEMILSKQYYSMGEVTAMFNESHSLIRYWESEFDILKPKKNGKGDRFFRPADVKNLYLIYDLLRRRKFTIEGAKEYLKNNKKADEKFAAVQSLQKIKNFFLELKASL